MSPFHFRPTLFFFLTLFCVGCGTVSPLYIPSSNGPERSFPPPPPALIRLPVIVTVPEVDGLGRDLSELFHGNLKNGVPDLAHWAGTQGFQVSRRLALWNLTGGKLVLGTTLHLLTSVGKNKASLQTPIPGGDEKKSGSLQVGV